MGKNNYNFQEREEYWRNFWDKENIYKFTSNNKNPYYTVDTPPPYVSAEHLHPGHIMSYSQAEFIVRFKRMNGFNIFYPMGFDDNGLPTERFVEKKYNINKNNIIRAEFIKKCLKETEIGSAKYKNLWTLLGISVDWSKTYSTMNSHSQRIAQWSFIDLFKKKRLVRKDEPIYWCSSCQTALAQADIEDDERESSLNFITFKSLNKKDLLIATTRPEFLPACLALFVNPSDKRYKKLIGNKAIVPIFNYEVPILADESVDVNFGTGLMMVCSWGDWEDVKKVKEHNLTPKVILNKDGTLNNNTGILSGLNIKQAQKKITNILKEDGWLKKQEKIKHIIPIHERCDTPIEILKTKQWFIKILDKKNQLLAQAEKMNWHPQEMKRKYIDWVNSLKWDWCISRQRYYGVPFPIWYCSSCKEIIFPDDKDLPIDPIEDKPKINKCFKCGNKEFIPEKDVMDTWMTSSCTPLIARELIKDSIIKDKLIPFSLRPQAFEIIRTWLFYTVVKFLYHFKKIPFKDIMISGHGLDDKGKKFSKRLGNFVPPEKVVEQYGADAIRYWATGSTLGKNLRYNEDEIKKGKRTVTKLYNAAKFCFSHFNRVDYSKLKLSDLKIEDKWILHHLNETVKKTTKYFDSYHYSKAKQEIDDFFWKLFCDNYLEFVKHRLYKAKPDESAKSVLYQCLFSIIKMYAPIIPFITEEIYQEYFYHIKKDNKSIHLSNWPKVINGLSIKKNDLNDFNDILNIISEIRKYKSDNQIPLGEEIARYRLKEDIPKKYINFVQSVTRVKKIV